MVSSLALVTSYIWLHLYRSYQKQASLEYRWKGIGHHYVSCTGNKFDNRRLICCLFRLMKDPNDITILIDLGILIVGGVALDSRLTHVTSC